MPICLELASRSDLSFSSPSKPTHHQLTLHIYTPSLPPSHPSLTPSSYSLLYLRPLNIRHPLPSQILLPTIPLSPNRPRLCDRNLRLPSPLSLGRTFRSRPAARFPVAPGTRVFADVLVAVCQASAMPFHRKLRTWKKGTNGNRSESLTQLVSPTQQQPDSSPPPYKKTQPLYPPAVSQSQTCR